MASPWECAEIFFVMEFYVFSAASHEGVCNSFVFDGEFEDVGFHGVGAFTDPAESRLYESSFVCLENISLDRKSVV